MKSSTSQSPEPERTLFDVARESGLSQQFRAQVETHVKVRKRKRRAVKLAAASAVAVAVVAFWLMPLWRDTASLDTLAATPQTVALADGSRAELSARTHAKTDFRYGRRIVRLSQGEAFFSVMKDAAHPFLVETPSGTVRVTGTQFNVRLTPPRGVEVTLLEGAVQMDGPESVRLAPSQQFNSTQTGVRTLSPAELDGVTAWRHGNLTFDGLSLAEAAGRIAAYHGCAITIAPEVAGLEPGGTFPLKDLPALLHALEVVLPVRVIADSDSSYRLVSR